MESRERVASEGWRGAPSIVCRGYDVTLEKLDQIAKKNRSDVKEHIDRGRCSFGRRSQLSTNRRVVLYISPHTTQSIAVLLE